MEFKTNVNWDKSVLEGDENDRLKLQLDVVVINVPNSAIDLTGYSLLRHDRLDGRRGGVFVST